MVSYKTLGFLGVKERKPTKTHFLLIEKANNPVGTSVRYPALGKLTVLGAGQLFYLGARVLALEGKEKEEKKGYHFQDCDTQEGQKAQMTVAILRKPRWILQSGASAPA